MRLVRGPQGHMHMWSPAERRAQKEAVGNWLAMGLEPGEAAAQLRKQYPGMGKKTGAAVVDRVLREWAEQDEITTKKKRGAALRRYYLMYRRAMQRRVPGPDGLMVADPDMASAVKIAARIDKLEGTEAPEVHLVGMADVTDAMRGAITSMTDDHMDEVLQQMIEMNSAAAAFKQEHGETDVAAEYARRTVLILGDGTRHQVVDGKIPAGEDAVGGAAGEDDLVRGGVEGVRPGAERAAPPARQSEPRVATSVRKPHGGPKSVHRAAAGASKKKR